MSEGKVKRKIIFLIFAAVMVVAGGCGTDGGDTGRAEISLQWTHI